MTVEAGTPTPGVSVLVTADRPETRLGTRLAFLVAGFGVASWAPLVPFVKERLQVDDGVLGLLLLCLGAGSIAAMLLTGVLSARYGSRPIILAGGFGLAVLLPSLVVAGSPLSLGLMLFAFGAALGSLDVAMNIHGVEVERAARQPLMSGFHALFSVGGFVGATVMTFLLSSRIAPPASTLFASVLMAIAMTSRSSSFAARLAFGEDASDCRATRDRSPARGLGLRDVPRRRRDSRLERLARQRERARKRGARRTWLLDVRNRNDSGTA